MSPQELLDLVASIEAGLIARSQGADYPQYSAHRLQLLREPRLTDLVPAFYKKSSSVDIAFQHMRKHASGSGSWAARREFVWENFAPVKDRIEQMRSGSLALVEEGLAALSEEALQVRIRAAIAALASDPASAVTKAATALAAVSKHILAEDGVPVSDTIDLPVLVRQVARTHLGLDTALGVGAFSGISNQIQLIAEIRNRYGDAHPQPAPSPELAEYAVATAGALSLLLWKHWERSRNP